MVEKQQVIWLSVIILLLMMIVIVSILMIDERNDMLKECKDNGYERITTLDGHYLCIKEVPSKTGLGYDLIYSGILT